MDQQELKIVGKGVRKKDAMALLLGKPAYVDDVTPRNCLVVKVLRSPHAHAIIEEIYTENAESIAFHAGAGFREAARVVCFVKNLGRRQTAEGPTKFK